MDLWRPQSRAILDAIQKLNYTATPSEISIQSGLPLEVTTQILNDLGSRLKAKIHVVKHADEQCNFRDEKAIEGDQS